MTAEPLVPATFVLALLASFALAAALTPLMGRVAAHYGVVAQPRRDRWHQRPTPLLGGVAMYLAVVLPFGFFVPLSPKFLGLLGGTTVIFLLGLVDDLRRVRPYGKLFAQIVAACLLIIAGIRVEIVPYSFIALPLTVFWVLAITNAFNLLDNMDGLAAGIAAIAALVLFAYNFMYGDVALAALCTLLVGASAGFLIYNFSPAKIFMGDAGSMVLGFLLAGIALMGTHRMASDVSLTLLVPVAVLGLPILDTALVTLVRSFHGRPIAQGGRDHLSHRLVALGLTERQAVLMLYLISGALGALGLASNFLGFWTSLALGSLVALALGLFGFFVAQVKIYSEAQYQRLAEGGLGRRLVIGGATLLYKRQVGEVLLDFVLICLAYLGAYLLKFEGTLTGPFLRQFADSLPYVIVAKLAMLFACGVYRPLWRYIGLADAVRISQATLLGSLLSVVAVALIFRFQGYSRSVFVIDWLLLTTLMVGVRMSFALLRDWFARLPRRGAARVLIVGAGDVGEMVLRAIFRDRNHAYQPVGFLDDDAGKHRRTIHGIRILGPTPELPALTEEVDEVIIALPPEAGDKIARVIACCAEAGIPCRQAGAFLEAHALGNNAPGTA